MIYAKKSNRTIDILGFLKKYCLFFLLPAWLAAHTLSIGPEAYYVERTRATGANQTGVLYGGQIAYNRIKCCGFYWGADAYYATGVLHGRNRTNKPLKSTLTDWQAEARLGFTIPYVTLYVGYGYLQEQINFISPSPTTFHYRDAIQYVTSGFLARVNWTCHFSTGLNAKVKWMTDGKSHISNDPAKDSVTLTMGNEPQYRVELPVNYYIKKGWEASFVPFYEFRHYGNKEGYPYDFIDTEYQIWGLQLMASYWF